MTVHQQATQTKGNVDAGSKPDHAATRRRRGAVFTDRVAPVTGVVAVGLVLAGHLVHGAIPMAGDPAAKVVAFYRDHGTTTFVGSVLLMDAAFVFLAFATVLRTRLQRPDGEGAAAARFGYAGAIVFAVGLAITAGIGITLGDSADRLNPVAIQALHVLFFELSAPMDVGIAVFLLGNSFAVVQSRRLPPWLGWLAVPLGIASLTPPPVGDIVGFLGLGVWLLLASALLTSRPQPGSPEAVTPDRLAQEPDGSR